MYSSVHVKVISCLKLCLTFSRPRKDEKFRRVNFETLPDSSKVVISASHPREELNKIECYEQQNESQ
jgi:hypothetical protein